MNSTIDSAMPSTTAVPMMMFLPFSSPKCRSIQRSILPGSSCSSSGRRSAEYVSACHALDHRVKKHDHAADERPAEDRVLFLDKVQLVDLFDQPVLGAADDGLLFRAAHENALDEGLSADGRAEGDIGVGFCGSGFAHMVTSVKMRNGIRCALGSKRRRIETSVPPPGALPIVACRRSG